MHLYWGHFTHKPQIQHIGHWQIQDSPYEGAPTLQAGVPTYKFARFPQKLHEIMKILVYRGAHAGGAPFEPPLLGYHRVNATHVSQ